MHGIEKVTDRIAQDAQAEIEAQLSQAQERTDQILAEYETQAREAVERILAHGQREVDAHRAQLHSMARLEARKRVLAAKQDVIEAAFEKALARLCATGENGTSAGPVGGSLCGNRGGGSDSAPSIPAGLRTGRGGPGQPADWGGTPDLGAGGGRNRRRSAPAAGPGRYQLYLFHASAATEGIAQCPSGRDSLSPRRAGVNDG